MFFRRHKELKVTATLALALAAYIRETYPKDLDVLPKGGNR